LRGHDQKECDNINMNLFVSDIRKILKKEKIPRVIIISNCASSLIATSFYKKYPNMVENLILLGFPQLKYLTLKSHIFHFIGHILLLARSLFNKTNKESVNWDKINNVSLIRFLMLVRKNMSFPNYLLSLDSMIHAKISLKDINVPSLLILIRSDDIINHKKLVFDTKGLSNISVEYVKKNHINDPEYDSITFKLIKTYLKKASKYP